MQNAHFRKFGLLTKHTLTPAQKLYQRNELRFLAMTKALQYRCIEFASRLQPLPGR